MASTRTIAPVLQPGATAASDRHPCVMPRVFPAARIELLLCRSHRFAIDSRITVLTIVSHAISDGQGLAADAKSEPSTRYNDTQISIATVILKPAGAARGCRPAALPRRAYLSNLRRSNIDSAFECSGDRGPMRKIFAEAGYRERQSIVPEWAPDPADCPHGADVSDRSNRRVKSSERSQAMNMRGNADMLPRAMPTRDQRRPARPF